MLENGCEFKLNGVSSDSDEENDKNKNRKFTFKIFQEREQEPKEKWYYLPYGFKLLIYHLIIYPRKLSISNEIIQKHWTFYNVLFI